VAQEETSTKVEGQTMFKTVTYAWFRCRLTQSSLPRRPDAANGGTRVERVPTLMFDVKDEDGDAVLLTARDKVEVRSTEQGIDTLTFELDGQPQPIRKKRKVIGYEVPVKRIETLSDARLP
jgi:hypothetical protein